MPPTTDGSPEPQDALDHYDIEPVTDIQPAGGTAGRTWRVATAGRAYFLRLRGVRTSTRERLVFDHGLRAHLAGRGIPTAVARPTKDGRRWLSLAGRVFELYPFVEGRPFDFGSSIELKNAARALARFHDGSRDYAPPEEHPLEIAQYAWVGLCDGTSDRMDDPALQVANIEAILNVSRTAEEKAAARWALGRAQRLLHVNAGEPYHPLLGWVIHGDYTPANLLFSTRGEVAGIFDFDWAMPGPRCRDIGDALYFFAGCRRAIDSGSIWTLTHAVPFDLDRCVTFLKTYHETSRLSDAELDAVPPAFEGRWLSIRIEGMAKVPEADRLSFFGRGDIHVPPEWLDRHWAAVRRAVVGS